MSKLILFIAFIIALLAPSTNGATHSIYLTFPRPNQIHYDFLINRIHLCYGISWDKTYNRDEEYWPRSDGGRDTLINLTDHAGLNNYLKVGFDLLNKNDFYFQPYLGYNFNIGYGRGFHHATKAMESSFPKGDWTASLIGTTLSIEVRKHIDNYYFACSVDLFTFEDMDNYWTTSDINLIIGYVFSK